MTNVLSPYAKQQFFNNNGGFNANGTITTYAAGTSTPIATYTSSGATNTNPIVLNARGECDIWLLPNTGYKFVLADPSGNTIWTVDNIVQDQLITLYGGVDTGIVNAYVISFSASFTSYTDGIVIIWIPSNTNTGASTINVNGIGVINITNGDGTPLSAGAITANVPAQILIKGGGALLLNPYSSNAAGSFTAGFIGFSSNPTQTTVYYRRSGYLVTLTYGVFASGLSTEGTSNSVNFIMTGVPAFLQVSNANYAQWVPVVGVVDAGTIVNTGVVLVDNAGNIIFKKDSSLTQFTASGPKGILSGLNVSFTYSIL